MRHRKGRSALTGLGVAFGVAIFFATMISNATTEASLRTIIDDLVGRADVWIASPGFEKYDESDIAGVEDLPDVRAVVPRTGHAATLARDDRGFTLVGTDIASDREIVDYELERGGRLPKPGSDELTLPRRLADELDVEAGRAIRIEANGRTSRWHVVGILENRGAGRVFEGRFMVGWLEQVQRATGSGEQVDTTLLVLEPATDAAQWIDLYEGELDENLAATEPGTQGGTFFQILAATQTALLAVSMVAVVVSVFLVYNSLSMALAERVQLYGTLRALGAERRQITRTVVVEALTLGTVSTAFGLGLGLVLARLLITTMEGIFEGDLSLDTFTIPTFAILLAAAVGIGVTLLASLIPARRAARVDPIVAMRNTQALASERRLGRAWILGVALIASSIALSLAGDVAFPFAMAILLFPLVGAILLVPLVLRPLGTTVGTAIAPIARGVGKVSVGHLTKARTRSALTLGILMAVLGMILTIGTINRSLGDAIIESIDREFGADFVVSNELGSQDYQPLDARTLRRLRNVESFETVSPLTFHTAQSETEDGDDADIFVDGADVDAFFSVRGFDLVSGEEDQVREGLRDGEILLTERTAIALDAERGDVVVLSTVNGREELRVTGVYRSANFINLAYVDERVARRIWGRTDPAFIEIDLRPGVSLAAGKTAIEAALAGLAFDLQTQADFEAEIRKEFNGFFAPFWAVLAISVLVGLLGIANTLAMAVLQRFREFGVLRAIGVGRGGVRRMVLVESLTMAGVAFILALPLGIYLSSQTIGGVGAMTGYEATWRFPLNWAWYVLAVAAAVGAIGAALPGRRAARIEIVEALAYE
ncbi:MAG: ABC transporter permease [Acidimicrobiia bacterium]|nr:ABC transporter permease [Acidimicrobiia bacterium]